MSLRLSLVAVFIFAASALRAAPPADKIAPEDEKLLKDGKIAVEGPALLDHFRKRTITQQEREKIDRLVRLLGDDSYKVREKASDDLLALGIITLPQLRRAVNDSDEEIRDRAREGIAAVEGKANPALSAAAARALRGRAPAETVKVLLDYVVDAENDAVADEVMTTLAIVGVKENKVDAALVEALKDKEPMRRAAAALVVGRSGTAEQRKKVQALLTDENMRVRLRAAQGLLAGRERGGVPTLIALLTDSTPDVSSRAEEMLSCLAAGHGAPRLLLSENPQQNKNVRTMWEQWWKTNAKIDLSRADVDLPPFNLTLRARETARQFLAAATAADKDKLEKLIEPQFTAVGSQVFTTREQTQQYVINIMQNFVAVGVGTAPLVQGTTTVEEYTKTAPQHEHQHLAKLPKKDVRVVLIQWPQNFGGRNPGMAMYGESAVFIRVSGDQPQVIGMSFGQDKLMRFLDR
jgi:HEAT repeat protein